MFENIAGIARELRSELLSVYWVLIIPLVIFLIILEFLKEDQQPINVVDILRRTIISVLLLISFEEVMHTLSFLSDGILEKLDQKNNFLEVMGHFGPSSNSKSGSLFDFREHILYFIAIVAYMIAYLGFFFAEALTHFVWAILYIVSPLMILAFIPKQTAFVTGNLYKSLIQVVLWRILWSTLGALLLRLAAEPQFMGFEDYLQSIVMNLCVGVSMLLVPMATKSLINDGLSSTASGFATAPAQLAMKYIKLKTMGALKFPSNGKDGRENFRNNQQSKRFDGNKPNERKN